MAVSRGQEATAHPVMCLTALSRLPERAVAVLFGVNSHLGDASVSQALWNLRDTLKPVGACCVLCVPLGYKFPPELARDVMTTVVSLPTEEAHAAIVRQLARDAQIPAISPAIMATATAALSGLSGWESEQATALSITRNGLDLAGLWERKRRAVEQTRGLSVDRSADTLESLAGLAEARDFFVRLLPVRCVVWLDEFEKMFSGHGTDTSGVSTELVGITLTELQERRYPGAVMYGHPGTGKSAFCKALAGTAFRAFGLTLARARVRSSARVKARTVPHGK